MLYALMQNVEELNWGQRLLTPILVELNPACCPQGRFIFSIGLVLNLNLSEALRWPFDSSAHS